MSESDNLPESKDFSSRPATELPRFEEEDPGHARQMPAINDSLREGNTLVVRTGDETEALGQLIEDAKATTADTQGNVLIAARATNLRSQGKISPEQENQIIRKTATRNWQRRNKKN